MTVQELFAKLGLKIDNKSFSAADQLLGGIKTALGAIAAFQTVKFLGGLVQDTAHAADGFVKMSQKIGVAIEPLQQLAYAAELSDVQIGDLSVSLGRFNKAIVEAKKGDSDPAKTFRNIGISIRGANGELRSTEDVLTDVADVFAGMEAGPEKTALAMKLFGKSGAQLIPLLNEGSGGIAKLRDDFVELGAQIDGETAKSFEEFNDDQTRVKTAFKGLRNQAVMALLPVLKDLVKGLLGWVKANREFIQLKLQKVLLGIISALKFFASGVGFAVRAIAFFNEHWKLFLVLIGSVTAALLVLKAASVAAALASAAAWIASLAPFVLLAAAIAAVILIVEDLYMWFTGGESVLKGLYDAAVEWVAEGMTAVIEDSIEFWKQAFRDFFQWIVDGFNNAVDEIVNFFSGKSYDEVIKAAIEDARNGRDTTASVTGGVPVRNGPGNVNSTSNKNVKADITVNIPPGMDAKQVGEEVATKFRKFWDGQMRDFAAASTGGQ